MSKINLWMILAIQASLILSIQGYCQYEKEKITCTESFLGIRFNMIVKLEVCDENVKATVTIKGNGFDYSHTFTSKTDVQIPGMSAGQLGGVYLRVELERDLFKEVHVKIGMAVKLVFFAKSFTIINKNLGEMKDSASCGFLAWLNRQSVGVQVAIYGGIGVVFLCVLVTIICCCCRRKSPGVVIVPPATVVQQIPLETETVSKGNAYQKF